MIGHLIVMLLVILQAGAAGATTLSRNPFKSPLPKAGAASRPAENGPAQPGMILKGIMIIDDHALVDLGGHILAIGEEAGGYTLMSVTEEQAVFLREGQRVVMSIYEDEKEDE